MEITMVPCSPVYASSSTCSPVYATSSLCSLGYAGGPPCSPVYGTSSPCSPVYASSSPCSPIYAGGAAINSFQAIPWVIMQPQFFAQHIAVQPQQPFVVQAAARGPAAVAPPRCSKEDAGEQSGSESTATPPGSAPSTPQQGSPGLPDLSRQVWGLSRDAVGCRTLQDALEAVSDAERVALAGELHGHVWAAAQCRHANHVLQKCIVTMRAESVQFIIEELTSRGPAATCKAARNQYGCRVFQRLLEHCSSQQVRGLVEHLFTDAKRLSTHLYGNFVLRHVFEYGPADQRARFAVHVREHALELGSDEKGCAVVAKALAHVDPEDRAAIALAILARPGLLVAMASTRHGRVAAEHLLQTAEGLELAEVRQQLSEATGALGKTRFGRAVLARLQASPMRATPVLPGTAAH